jgi:hypothetical protein
VQNYRPDNRAIGRGLDTCRSILQRLQEAAEVLVAALIDADSMIEGGEPLALMKSDRAASLSYPHDSRGNGEEDRSVSGVAGREVEARMHL